MAESPQSKRAFLAQQGALNRRPQDVRHEIFKGGNEFFDPEDLVQVKYEMLRLVKVEKASISEAAQAFGFSRPSFYQARSSFQDGGLAGLLPHKRGPRSGHKLTPELMSFVLRIRAAEPGISSSQVAERIAEHFGVSVHPRSIDRQLRVQKKLR
jgi:transposase